MTDSTGYSVRIFMPSGDSRGLRIIEKSQWTGQGVAFPRAHLSGFQDIDELKRSGVYILWGPDESVDVEDMPQVYIGESDQLLKRLQQHDKKKDFWKECIAFSTKDHSLNSGHLRYLEAKLINFAKESARCTLVNETTPQVPILTRAEEADMEAYLKNIHECLPFLGMTFFEKPGPKASSPPMYRLTSNGIQAQGYEDTEGFIVCSGSTAVKEDAVSISKSGSKHNYISVFREELRRKGVLEESGSVLKLKKDYFFKTPSAASCVLLARSSNGLTAWKDDNGKTLRQIRQENTP